MKKIYRLFLVMATALALALTPTLPLWGQAPDPAPAAAELAPVASGTYETVACEVLVSSPPGSPRTPFPQDGIEGTDYECGYLTVPELHDQPDGNTTQVGVAVLKSTAPDPAEPLVMFQGGPGGSSIDIFPSLFGGSAATQNQEAADELETLVQESDNALLKQLLAGAEENLGQMLRRDRDLIIFEKRGNLYSKPRLACDGDDEAADSDDPDVYRGALQACRDQLTAQGINPAAYNSVESARDVAALVSALGYEQVNLYGVSYGTELAQVIMRLYPDMVRSVILDGIVPSQPSLETQYGVIIDRLINTVDAACAAEPDCDASYPDVRETFEAAYNRLDETPATVELRRLPNFGRNANPSAPSQKTVEVSGADFAHTLFQLAYTKGAPFIMPAMIYQVSEGDYGLISQALYTDFLSSEDDMAYGTFFSVRCSEDTAYADQLDTTGVSPLAVAWGQAQFQESQQSCQVWNVPAIDPAMREPVVSDTPALLFNGNFDPITPPPYGEIVAQGLSNNTFVVFPANGHGAIGTDCSVGIMAEFLNNPEQSPDTSCANDDNIVFASDANTLIKPGTHWLAQSLVGAGAKTILRRLGLLIFFMLFPVIWLVMSILHRMRHREHYPMPRSASAKLAVGLGLLLGFLSVLWIVAQVLGVGATVLLGGHGALGYTQLFVGIDRRFALIYIVPILIALTSVALLVLALLSWRGKYWDRNRRIYFSIMAGMAMVYTLYLAQAGQLTVLF